MEDMNNFITGWMSHRKALLELIDVFEDKHLSYKPWDNGMTVSELVLHITGATDMFIKTVKNGEFTPPAEPKAYESVTQLKVDVQAETDEMLVGLQSLNKDQLIQLVEFYGMKMPGIALLENGKEHEIHHKGQLFTYARLLGIETLPFFISRS
jgi:uncharacterized damage-inducible protein DinB